MDKRQAENNVTIVTNESKDKSVNWLLIDFNSYFASCEQQEHPELRGRPIAIVAMITENTGVLAASYEAKRCGIKTNTLVSEAKKLCPNIRFIEAHHRLYLDYHDRLLETIEEIIPIHSVLSVDEMSCELMGSQKKLANAVSLAKKLKAHIRDKIGVCMTSSIGLGPNILIAKMASDMQKPDGLVCVPKSEILKKIGPLSVRDIPGVGAQTEIKLNQYGFFQVHDLLKITAPQAQLIWGSILGSRTLRGLQGYEYNFDRSDTKSISHQHVLPPDLRTFDKALFIAIKLLNKACVRLRRGGYLCGKLSLYIKFIEGSRFENQISFQNTSDTGFFIKQLYKLWRFSPLKKPMKVSIILSKLSNSEHRQLSFFDEELNRREKAFAIADQINEKLGPHTIHVADLMGLKDKARGGIAFSRVPKKDEFE